MFGSLFLSRIILITWSDMLYRCNVHLGSNIIYIVNIGLRCYWIECYVYCGAFTAFTLTPINTTVCSGSTAQFVCSATDVTTVFYSMQNVYISAPTYSGGATIVNMSISNASANAVITCHAYLVNGTVLTRTAYLTVQGTGGCTHMHKCIESHISLKYQVLHLPPLTSTLLHTMILLLYWSGDHPLMPSPHPSSPMLW